MEKEIPAAGRRREQTPTYLPGCLVCPSPLRRLLESVFFGSDDAVWKKRRSRLQGEWLLTSELRERGERREWVGNWKLRRWPNGGERFRFGVVHEALARPGPSYRNVDLVHGPDNYASAPLQVRTGGQGPGVETD
jgi:hypothetical protein